MIELGTELGPNLEPTGETLSVEPTVFVDDVLVLGAQGAGKTTLGAVIVDQLLAEGRPLLVFDTAGDLTDHLAARHGLEIEDGPGPATGPIRLERIGGDIARNMFRRPDVEDEYAAEERREKVAALLGFLGYRVRPASPEFALLEMIVEGAVGVDGILHLDSLADTVLMPPFSKLGVFDIDTVISSDRRADLSAAIRGLLQSPGFEKDESRGRVTSAELFYTADGSPVARVISFHARSATVRQFLVAVLLAEVKAYAARNWTEGDLSVFLYFDEGSSFLPRGGRSLTTAPLLDAISNWGRFGVGVGLVADEPGMLHEDVEDLCETWLVGGMPVGRARRDVVAALDLVNPPIDEEQLDGMLKRLQTGQFVLRTPRLDRLRYFAVDR